jgi:hypothetical protein
MSPDNIQSFIDSYNQMRIDKGDIAPLKTQPLKTEYEYVHRQYIRYPDRTLKPIKKLIADKCIISDGLVVSSPPELTYDVVINIFTKLLDPNYGASTFPFITKTTMTGGADTLLDNIINGVPILPLLISTNLPFNGAFKPASQSIYNYKEFTIRMDKLNVDDLTESELYEREGDIITIKEDRLLDAIVMTSYGGDIMPELVSFSYSRYNGAWYAFTVIRKLGTDLEHISAQDILSQPIDGLIEVLKWLRDAWTSSGFIHNRLTAMNIIVSRDNVLLQDFSHSQFNFKSLIIRGIKTPSSGNNDLCTFLLTLFTPEYFNQATEYKTPVFEALEHYVEKPNITQLERQAIYEYIRNAEPMTIRVYRGQMSKELEDSDWYSTSIRRSVGEHFSSMPTSTLFIINVVNVPAIDVNEVLLSEGGWLNDRYDTEDEILVLGGGDFYSNADMTMRGMTKVDERTYETWYTMAGDNMESMSKKMRLRHSSLKNQ